MICKIDLITGFLGAGKTTFVNELLRYYMRLGHRPVYIVNEFGQTGLDAEIIRGEGFNAMEIEGGCICCTLKDQVASAILEIIETFGPTHIVFEPSGIFIFDNFYDMLKDPTLEGKCTLGYIITLVDAINFDFAKTTYGGFMYNQIKNTSTIVLSKLEKADVDIPQLCCDIRNINPNTDIFLTPFIHWEDEDFEALEDRVFMELQRAEHHPKLQTFTIQLEGLLEDVDDFIAQYHTGTFGELYRVKGIVKTQGGYQLINIAHQDIVVEKFKGMGQPSLTFIGMAVDKDAIAGYFANLGMLHEA